jgi:hypothetical protein
MAARLVAAATPATDDREREQGFMGQA